MMQKRLSRMAAVVCLLSVSTFLYGCHSSAAVSGAAASTQTEVGSVASTLATADAPLKALQADFRPSYNEAREQVNRGLSPLVVVRFSDMFLVKDGQVIAEGKGIPRKYHLLHRSAHVPLVIFLRLQPHFGSPLPHKLASDLSSYRQLVEAAITDLGNYRFTPQEIQWQETILKESALFLGSLRAGAPLTLKDYRKYRARVHRSMMALADAAGAAQVDATHATMVEWRKKLTDDEWDRLRVIIVGPRQPRHDYSSTQYFAALFPERGNSVFPGENRRVFYVERLTIDRNDRSFEDERRAVATLILDAFASETVFNNPYRMSIDVMAGGARRRIAELDLTGIQ